MKIAIVIVTYNSAEVLEGCLESLSRGSQGTRLSHVVVADNASADNSCAVATSARELPVQVVQMGRNAGYAAAVNAGVDSLPLEDLDAVLVLNPDCRLHPGSLGYLAKAMDLGERRGITVPRLVNPDQSLQPSLRRDPAIHRQLAESVIGGTRAGRIGSLGELITDPRHYDQPGPAVWATGAAMLISTSLIKEIGSWDESFFLYSEETEYALRARDHGWSLWYEPQAVFEHIGGESDTNPALYALLMVNRVRLFYRRRGRIAGGIHHGLIIAGESVRALTGRRTARAALKAVLRPSKLPWPPR
ncbi:glycosyltransferase family 2 protein [Nonomuraea sp. NPDC050663]|uniref:glycosyltransferase family 2 protein n=1 Tax=Nonomuraea sp. NPDC050663 TaxID=3364370 RepID=UPI0037A185D8